MHDPLQMPRRPTGAPSDDDRDSLWAAATDVFSAGQEMLLDRVDLLQAEASSELSRVRAEVISDARSALGHGALVTVGASLAWTGWCALSISLAFSLHRWWPADAAAASVGAANLLLGLVVARTGLRSLQARSRREVTHA